MKNKKFRFWASAFYLAFYAATGSFVPFLNAHYQNSGIPVEQIGLLAALLQLTTLFANPMWAFTADAFHLHGRLLPMAMLLLLPLAWLVANFHFFAGLVGLVFLYALFQSPIIPLGDNAVMEELGEARYEYGRLRIWGAIGFGPAAWFGGTLMERWGMDRSIFVFLVFMAAGSLVATQLPRPRQVVKTSFLTGLRSITVSSRWRAFLVSIFLAGLGFAVLNNYLILFLRTLGAGESLYGLAVAAAGVSELPVFFFSTWLIQRWSPRGLLLVSMIALAARLVLTSLIREPYIILAIQLLHGLTFSALWAAGVSYSSELAPTGLGASAQALFGMTLFGLSGMVGAFLGGQVYQYFGPAAVFQWTAAAVLIGAGLFWIGMRPKTRPSA